MAVSSIAVGDAFTKKVFEEKTFKASIKESFWMGRVGSLDTRGSMDNNGILTINSKLDGNSGDTVNIQHVPRLAYTAITESGTVEGNEGSLTPYNFQLILEEANVALRLKNTRINKGRVGFDWEQIHRQRVEGRGSEVIDEQLFTALQATDPNKVFYGGSAPTSTATLTTSDLLTPRKFVQVATWAETGGNRTQNSIGKINMGGRRGYVGLIHNNVFYDLWNDSTIQNSYKDAGVRGDSNPLYREAELVWNGHAFFKHENIDIFTNGGAGANVPYAKGFLIGQGAMAWAWGRRPELVEDTFDYKREKGFNFCYTAAAGRPEFNSLDYGVVGIYTARTKVVDA